MCDSNGTNDPTTYDDEPIAVPADDDLDDLAPNGVGLVDENVEVWYEGGEIENHGTIVRLWGRKDGRDAVVACEPRMARDIVLAFQTNGHEPILMSAPRWAVS